MELIDRITYPTPYEEAMWDQATESITAEEIGEQLEYSRDLPSDVPEGLSGSNLAEWVQEHDYRLYDRTVTELVGKRYAELMEG